MQEDVKSTQSRTNQRSPVRRQAICAAACEAMQILNYVALNPLLVNIGDFLSRFASRGFILLRFLLDPNLHAPVSISAFAGVVVSDGQH